jgi:hypothetical protein
VGFPWGFVFTFLKVQGQYSNFRKVWQGFFAKKFIFINGLWLLVVRSGFEWQAAALLFFYYFFAQVRPMALSCKRRL